MPALRTKRRSMARRKHTARPKTFPKTTSAVARRRGEGLQARVDLARELRDWSTQPINLPPQSIAMTFNQFLANLCAELQKIAACAKMGDTLNAIDDHLKKFGSQLSQEDYDNFNEQGEQMWEDMVNMGCPQA